MARRQKSKDLFSLFESSTAPVYALDAGRRLIYVNPACARWMKVEAEALLGRESRYHSEPEIEPADAAAAALSPPPEAFAGTRCEADIHPLDVESESSTPRRFQFIPLTDDGGELNGVLAVGVSAAANAEDSAGASEEQLHQLLRQYRSKLALRYRPDRIVGTSPAIRRARAQVSLAASADVHVTIVGPPGSGRLHAARAIHYGQEMNLGNISVLECGDLSNESLQGEITRAAKLTASGRATLVLRGADHLSVESQAELSLRLPSLEPHVRLIALSGRPLVDLSLQGRFRGELAHALSAIVIELPPLAERKADLPLLCQALVEEINARSEKQLSGVTPEALDRLAAYAFPGNLDELAAMLEAAHAQARGAAITARDLSERLRLAADAQARPRRVEETIRLDEFLADVERELVTRALKRAKGNKAKAARLLGLTRPRLYRRLVQLGLIEADAVELPDFVEQPEES